MSAPSVQRGQRSEAARLARQEEILDAARRVFAERGFKGTTIADVAEAAGIALGTIYLYFKSKDEIFAVLGQRLHALIAEAFNQGDPEPTLDATVRLRVRNVFAACGENRDLVRLVVRQALVVGLAGVAGGLAAAVMASRALATLLYGVRPSDPITFAAVPVALLLLTIAASLAPALRAARIDPLRVLRGSV